VADSAAGLTHSGRIDIEITDVNEHDPWQGALQNQTLAAAPHGSIPAHMRRCNKHQGLAR